MHLRRDLRGLEQSRQCHSQVRGLRIGTGSKNQKAHTSWCMPLAAEQMALCVQELDFFFVMIDVILLT
jgi:hypothetical protein